MLLKGYCKHPSCSVNTKRRMSHPDGLRLLHSSFPFQGPGLGAGASRPRRAIPTAVLPHCPPAPPRREQTRDQEPAHPESRKSQREGAARSRHPLKCTHASAEPEPHRVLSKDDQPLLTLPASQQKRDPRCSLTSCLSHGPMISDDSRSGLLDPYCTHGHVK